VSGTILKRRNRRSTLASLADWSRTYSPRRALPSRAANKGEGGHSAPSSFLRCSSSSQLLENNRAFLHVGQSPGLARRRLPFHPMVYLEPAAAHTR
jgi:hypothetical protein